MKERITYVLRDSAWAMDPANVLDITTDALTISGVDAAKEHQVTIGLGELPDEIRNLLTSSHELHVRWSSSRPYDAVAPFVSRLSAGLHVFYSPLSGQEVEGVNPCLLLNKAFGSEIKCDDVERSFITPPILSERFAHSASRQLYAYVPTAKDLVRYLVPSICPTADKDCKLRVLELLAADSIDLDYDSISHALSFKALWSKPYSESGWSETLKPTDGGALEVGILTNEKEDEVEELRYSGFLTQVGKDSTYSPTLFSFPSRHHPLPSTSNFTTTFLRPTGLHPTLQLSIPSAATRPPNPSCHLHTYFTLPSSVFIDRYPLSDPLFLASHHLKALHALSGATDLEAPDYVVNEWGSAALFEVDTASSASTLTLTNKTFTTAAAAVFTVTIPLHARYLPPAHNSSGISQALIPDPVVFWACPADSGSQFPSSPFERVNLGYEGLFGVKTMFYHFKPTVTSPSPGSVAEAVAAGGGSRGAGKLVQSLTVPVLDLDGAGYVEVGTAIAVILGALFVAWPLVRRVVGDFRGRWKDFQVTAKAGAQVDVGDKHMTEGKKAK